MHAYAQYPRISRLVAAFVMFSAVACDSPTETPAPGQPAPVPPTPVAVIEITTPVGELTVGQALPLTVRLLSAAGTPLDRPVTWTSSDTTVAKVSTAGVLSAQASGTARITAVSGTRQSSIDVVVRPTLVLPGVATHLLPASVQAGAPAFELRIRGANFAPGATVRWAGQERPARYIDATEIRIDVTAADVRHPGAAEVQVQNPGATLSSRLYFTIETVPATHVYDLVGVAWAENPALPVQVGRWPVLDAGVGLWHHQRVSAGVLRIHDRANGRRDWDLTLSMQIVRESDGFVQSDNDIVFFGTVEYAAPEGHMVLRSGQHYGVALQTITAFNGDIVVWQSLHPTGDPIHEIAWRYRKR